jgi:transposase
MIRPNAKAAVLFPARNVRVYLPPYSPDLNPIEMAFSRS